MKSPFKRSVLMLPALLIKLPSLLNAAEPLSNGCGAGRIVGKRQAAEEWHDASQWQLVKGVLTTAMQLRRSGNPSEQYAGYEGAMPPQCATISRDQHVAQ